MSRFLSSMIGHLYLRVISDVAMLALTGCGAIFSIALRRNSAAIASAARRRLQMDRRVEGMHCPSVSASSITGGKLH